MLRISFDSLLCATLLLSAVTAAASTPVPAVAPADADRAAAAREEKAYLPALPYEITAMAAPSDSAGTGEAERNVKVSMHVH